MGSDFTIRDHFAAAALTGLLSNVQRYQNEPLTRQAFEIADFMLRERCRAGGDCPGQDNTPNLDAAPAARASEATASPKRVRVRGNAGTGDTQEPVAWAVVYPNDEVAVIAFKRQDADERATASDRIVPLYRHPQSTLTDAEREAVERAADWLDRWQQTHGYHSSESGDLATLRGLLERLA